LLVTSSVTGNFNLVCRAMGHGGLDAVNTPTLGPGGAVRDGEGILSRLAKLERARRASYVPAQPAPDAAAPATLPPPSQPLVVLGASTGGPAALARVLKALPADFPAGVVLVQHIAGDFAPGLAHWLQGHGVLPVRLARDGDVPRPGEVLLAGTDDHLILRPDRRLAYTPEPVQCPYRPSVDVFFGSVASAWTRPGVAVLLTGMGSDGARGLLQLRRLGWHTLTEDESSSVVFGMPRAAAELDAACRILPLDQIPEAILDEVRLQKG
jgi:two-component system response regulator WspF